ncbi:MAG: hypothetical protein WAS49_08510 [Candidatus Dechloromonas phosphoritropha]|nr:hypothetical protein [Candidatus Dechloromonas phosphoritropha]MBP8789617.1 hypothetical protein [Azonexus sp.]
MLFDGRGGENEARIKRIEKDRVLAALGTWHDVERESALKTIASKTSLGSLGLRPPPALQT